MKPRQKNPVFFKVYLTYWRNIGGSQTWEKTTFSAPWREAHYSIYFETRFIFKTLDWKKKLTLTKAIHGRKLAQNKRLKNEIFRVHLECVERGKKKMTFTSSIMQWQMLFVAFCFHSSKFPISIDFFFPKIPAFRLI